MNKILAIDDNLSILVLQKAILNKGVAGCLIFTAQSGEAGIKIALEELPDVILLDIIMPGIDGFKVCELLKANEQTSHIPILLVSALGHNTEDRIKGLNMGADAFITKPFENAELISQVKVLLRIKSAEDLLKKQNKNLEIFIKKQTIDYHNSENRFLQISEYALEYFWEVDSTGLFTYVSAVIEQILGYKSEDIIGKEYLFDFPKTKHPQSGRKSLIDVFKNRNNYKEVELFCITHKGKKSWLTLSGFPVFDDQSTFIGYRGVTHDITLRRQAEEDLEKSLAEIKDYQTKLKKLNLELVLAEEKERRRIAEYLHDGIGQIMSTAHIKLSSLLNKEMTPDIRKTIRESSNFLSMAIVQSRTLTYDLSPPILYELGLIPAIRWKLEQIEIDNHIATAIQNGETRLSINNDTRIILYRIICELMNNVIKHAKADLIEVQISQDQNFYYFAVRDNGQGFDFKAESKLAKKGGQGLFSIRERLEAIQGKLIIESEPNKGTKASISIPVKKGKV